MPKEIEFRDTPNDEFPAPPGAKITRSMPAAVQGFVLTQLRRGMRIKQVLAREPQQREDDNTEDKR
jgi:hypothetical protein